MTFTNSISRGLVALTALLAPLLIVQGTALAYESPVHVFSIDDVMGDFEGTTFGPTGISQDPSIICGLDGGVACPDGIGPVLDKSGVMLYPVDSEYGFYIVDFLGAQGKARDGDYLEGFVGNIVEEGVVTGIQVSNAATEKYKVKPPLGTWCQGLAALRSNARQSTTPRWSTCSAAMRRFPTSSLIRKRERRLCFRPRTAA